MPTSSDSDKGLFGVYVRSKGECFRFKNLSEEEINEETGLDLDKRVKSQDGDAFGLNSSHKGPIPLSNENSSPREPRGQTDDKLETDLTCIGLHVDIVGGLEPNSKSDNKVKVGLKVRPDDINTEITKHSKMVRSEKMARVVSIKDSFASSKGRRGNKRCYSTKIHGMRTGNAIQRELEAQERKEHAKQAEENRDTPPHNLTETEVEVVDMDGNRVVWNLEDEVSRVIEIRSALTKEVNGKTSQIFSETEVELTDMNGNRVMWNTEEEIMRVIENRVTLGFDF
ncbi:hypothetical protein QYF36_002230 [Acer negundo]|nr:hypothetical protein QYF36_002230 [Acer negundo]